MENYLTFTVKDNSYAINVSSVLEVLNLSTPTSIPCALPYIEGLIYSRDQGITVLNLRKRFKLEPHEPESPERRWLKQHCSLRSCGGLRSGCNTNIR